ncbi:MAG: class I SAM-dependent methyltransferase [Phycisphaerales bacterium]|nr:class I SAM-dependent methyltransferase [Phycisphaerales bacterium]
MSYLRKVFPYAVLLFIAGSCVTKDNAHKERNVRPGINDRFKETLDVDEWIGRFEGESREIYKHRQAIVDSLGLRFGMDVADIGAGTGFFTLLFADRVGQAGRVYAVDIARDFLEHIELQAKEKRLTNIETILNKDDSAELPPTSIDLAFICDTYHHFEYPRTMMRSIHRALRPGGEVVVVDFHRSEANIAHLKPERQSWIRGHVRADQEQFIREIKESGFEFVSEVPEIPLRENYVIRFRKVL